MGHKCYALTTTCRNRPGPANVCALSHRVLENDIITGAASLVDRKLSVGYDTTAILLLIGYFLVIYCFVYWVYLHNLFGDIGICCATAYNDYSGH